MEAQEVILEGGYEGLFTVSNEGSIFSWRSGSKKEVGSYATGKTGQEYKTVCLRKKDGKQVTRYVHRLVALAFIPNPENKLTVNHIDGDKLNNSVENLEWATLAENTIHAWKTGLCDKRLSQEEKDTRTMEIIYSKLSKVKYKRYKQTASKEILLREGIPPRILEINNPKNVPLAEFWSYLKVMCEDFLSDMLGKDLEIKYNLTTSGVSRVRAKNRQVDMWACYEEWILIDGL